MDCTIPSHSRLDQFYKDVERVGHLHNSRHLEQAELFSNRYIQCRIEMLGSFISKYHHVVLGDIAVMFTPSSFAMVDHQQIDLSRRLHANRLDYIR